MERIYVTVRARPLSAEDAKSSPWRISGNSISIPNQPTKFEFDRIFEEECKTAEVYGAKTKEIVSSAVRGFNGTVFAYGQTNSGKTHTMRGTVTEPGIIPQAVHDLFQSIQETLYREFLVRMSYMEIYNEEINDLLVPEHRKLQIHESLDRGIFVAGLREEIVTSAEQVLDLMLFGESHRHIGETNMNVYSSRSHTIFRMIIESRERNDADDCGNSCDAVRVSILNLVDLAGSERAAKTGAEGVRLKEGSHINKSLMTLGTVIKKLSEGAESQGGHVPYRDSKLTRILQPALGGNANTAIICNITLAQIHADETKSSLQFASRALRVTNCACVNEILTDAALLKRQKKEIEELRARLQGSHSEHWEKKILSLRNTLLQSELEKERIALELEEEKKAKAQRDRRLLEQAEKIANLSSMVLYSKIDEDTSFNQKKRRNTWCPGPLLRQASHDVTTTPSRIAANTKPDITELGRSRPLPFAELVQENELVRDDIRNSCVVNPEDKNESFGDFSLPDAHALLHVTNRRKAHYKNTRVLKDIDVQKTRKEIECEYPGITPNECSVHELNQNMYHGRNSLTTRESEAILVIKQLEDQIKLLEMEKASVQENLDSVMTLATEQNATFREKYDELQKDLSDAHEDAKVAKEHLCCIKSVKNFDEMTLSDDLKREIQEVALEFHSSREATDNVLLIFKHLFENYSGLSKVLMELKASASQDMKQFNLIIDLKNSILCGMQKKIDQYEIEKVQMNKDANDNEKKIQELNFEIENSKKLLAEQSSQHDLEKDQLFHEMLTLQKELSSLSSSSLAKEKETFRKDLEKAKIKLKETESKLKNAIQDKGKLESEKAQMERELKRLHGQKAHLERDISKHESFTERRRDSKALDSNKMKGHTGVAELKLQMDYQKLEVFAFEMEAEIASLKEELLATMEEKQEALHTLEAVDPELQDLVSKLNTAYSELELSKEEMAAAILRLNESQTYCKKLEDSVTSILKEKEEMALELTDALLELEAEKSNRSDMEKVSLGLTEEVKASSHEVLKLAKELREVKFELESCQEKCKVLQELLTSSEEVTTYQNDLCLFTSSVNTQLKDCAEQHEIDMLRCEERLKTKSGVLSSQHDNACEEVCNLQKQLDVLLHERDELLLQLERLNNNSYQTLKGEVLEATKERNAILAENEELRRSVADAEITKQNDDNMLSLAKSDREVLSRRISIMETEMHEERLSYCKEKTKLRMRLQSTQAKLDAYRGRYSEIVDEMCLMNRKFEEASTKLKEQLASYGKEILRLKKELSSKQ